MGLEQKGQGSVGTSYLPPMDVAIYGKYMLVFQAVNDIEVVPKN